MKFHDILKEQRHPLLFGHRGYSAIAPENTLAAFRMCIDKGIPGVELDVHLCKTGELVVVHDSNLKRVGGVDLVVEELPFDQLRTIDVGSHKGPEYAGARIPKLEELFELCGASLYYDIELKTNAINDTGLAEKTWKTIERFGLRGRCMVSSFNPFAVRRFGSVSKQALPTAVIFSDDEGVPKIFRKGWGRHIARCTYLKPDYHLVDGAMFDKFHRKMGYPIMVWTVDTIEACERMLDLGVDGIISNNPGDFLDMIGKARR